MANDCQIWQVALATVASPGFFPPVKFDGNEYIDGGFSANNPSNEAFQEISNLHPSNPLCLVSIGSGKRKFVVRFPHSWLGRYYNYLRAAVRFVTDTENVHQIMSHFAATSDKLSYFRFNVPGLEDVFLDECTVKNRKEWPATGKMHTIDFIERQTTQYLAQDETRTSIRTCAQMVVDSYFRSSGCF